MQGKKFIAISVIIVFLGYVVYGAVVSIPNHYVKDALSLADSLSRQQQKIESRQQSFNDLKSGDDWRFLSPYAEEANWSKDFNKSLDLLEQAKTINEEQVVPILDRDHKDDIAKLVEAINKSRELAAQSNQLSQQPLSNAALLIKSRDNKQAIHSETQSIAKRASDTLSAFFESASQSSEQYPDKTEDIEQKQVHLQSLLDTIQNNADIVNDEFNASNTDFAQFANAHQTVNATNEIFNRDLESYNTLLGQLHRSYVKVLTDQRVDWFITIGRANWCEGEYCREGIQMRSPPVTVDTNTFEYFDTLQHDRDTG